MRRLSLAVTIGLCVTGAAPTAAQDRADAAPPNARQVLQDVYAHYRSLDTYAAQMTSTMDVETTRKNVMFGAMGEGMKKRVTFRFARPARVYYESDQTIVVADGATLTHASPMMMEYLERPAVADVEELGQWIRPMMSVSSGKESALLLDPIAMVTSDEADVHRFLDQLRDLTAAHVDYDGDPRIHITATMAAESVGMPGADDIAIPLEMWIDARRRVITRQQVDTTEIMNLMMRQMAETRDNPMLKDMRYERMVTILDIEDQQLNPVLDAEAFTYDWKAEGYEKAGPGSQYASMFGTRTSPLLGVEAPEIVSKTIDDEPFRLSDLRGNVVLLDFWATWCSPCVMAMPKIQELHEHFADRPVRVIGINQDAGSMTRVRKLLEKKKITFLQVRDGARETGQAYEVSGIPTTVVIDKEGIVQAVHLGFMPGAKKELTDQIETLLAGGTLVTEADLEQAEARRAELQEFRALEAREDEGEVREEALEELAAHKVVKNESYPGWAMGPGQLTRLDVDGDGRDELLLPSTRANYSILYADGTTEPLRLQGIPRIGIGAIAAARRNGQPHLAYTTSSGSMGGMRLIIGLWRIDGTRVWSNELRHDNNSVMMPTITTGDVDGDGREEIIVAISVTKYDAMDEDAWAQSRQMKGFLVIYDLDGNCLARRKLADQIYSVVAMPGAGGGTDLIVQTTRKVVRFTFDDDAPAPPAEDGEE